MKAPKWPKSVPLLTSDENALKEQIFLDVQQWGYTGLLGWVQNQGHIFVEKLSQAKSKNGQPLRSIEIGSGSGWHFRYVSKKDKHMGLDLRTSLLQRSRMDYRDFPMIQGNGYHLPFINESFDRIVSIYVFEHLSSLPDSLAEIRRVLKPEGELLVGLPTEGGLAFDLGRRLTTKKYFEQKYKVDYLKIVRSEHCNTCQEVTTELENWFTITDIWYLPFFIPTVHLNAIAVIRCIK